MNTELLLNSHTKKNCHPWLVFALDLIVFTDGPTGITKTIFTDPDQTYEKMYPWTAISGGLDLPLAAPLRLIQ